MMADEQLNIRLVQVVEKYPIIYNFCLPDHCNKGEVDKAWNEVSKEMNLSVGVCKEKWRNCRNSWARHLRHTRANDSGLKSKRPYYLSEYLGFLMPFSKPRKLSQQSFQVLEELESASTNEDLSSVTDEDQFAPIDEVETEIMPPPPPSSFTMSQKRKRHSSSVDIDRLFAFYLASKVNRDSEETENPDLTFFKSILPDVARLTPSLKSSFKIHVLQKLNDLLYSAPSIHTYNH